MSGSSCQNAKPASCPRRRPTLVFLLFAFSFADAKIFPSQISILVNENSPESRLVGKFYRGLRAIPSDNMLFIRTVDSASISREKYQTEIEQPVRKFLTQKQNYPINYLVTTKGLPVKISPTGDNISSRPEMASQSDVASLESELMNALKSFAMHAGWNKRDPSKSVEKPETRELIVMRLDGPSVVEIKKYLSVGVSVEKKGLKGDFCIDARGIDSTTPPFYHYDRSLINMAEGLKEQMTDVKVILDRKGDAMNAEKCTEPVLYVGWEPGLAGKALPWQPGAVGFCIALTDSFSFQRKSQKLDAIEITRRGACHSLGGVGPAFLSAYPVPHHFFPLILGGNHDMGEVIKQTAPHSSWTITYLGDPMYCPFRANSQLDIDQVEKWLRKPLDPEKL